ncbi:MAG: hypothetical protein IT427_13685 [Pirellulales bacterium]|nr:hypothetical protein [Pirellulales bacterium]
MRPNAKRLVVAVLLALVFTSADTRRRIARAADGEPQTAASPPATAADDDQSESTNHSAKPEHSQRILEQPAIKYVRDKQGRLVPLLGFTWEELQEFHRRKQAESNGASQPRSHDLQQLVIAGEATENRAQLTATYTIRLGDEQLSTVPLVTGGAVLIEPASYHGPGDQRVQFDAATGGYSVVVQGPAKSQHELTLKYFVTLKNVHGQRRLEVDLPTAAASRLSIVVPHDSVSVTTYTGAVTADVGHLDDGKSEIHAWGLGGPLSLMWKEGAATVAPATSRLEVEGQILAELDSRSVRFDALLTVRSLADEFDRFQIKLPAKSSRVAADTNNAGYTLTGGTDDEGIVTVQLAQKSKGPVKVRIAAERAYDATNPSETLELAGFDVVEALPHLQWGHIAVVVRDDWRLSFSKTERVRQIEELPPALKRDDAIGFKYFGRPASLAARVSPRKTQIALEPEYTYKVEADRIRLEAKLKYTIRGGKVFDLAVEMPGWTPDGIEPTEAIDAEQFWSGEGPLQTAHLPQGINGKFELTISAHRYRAEDRSRIELVLPTPHADKIEPAAVLVQPENNVRLRPDEEEIVGLTRVSSANTLRLPPREQPPFSYRADQPHAKFVAVAEPLPQAMSVAVDGAVEVRHDGAVVEQQLEYRVEHEPLSELTLLVPRQVENQENWQILIDDVPVAPISGGTSPDRTDKTTVRVPLLESRFGRFTAKIKYRLPFAQADFMSGDPVKIPLVMPPADLLVANRLTVTRESALRVTPDDEAWTIDEEPASGLTERNGIPPIRLSATGAQSEIQLDVSREVRQGTGSTVVERGWVQTWIGGGVRQDRAAYVLSSSEEQISFTLPSGPLDHVQIKVDDESIPAQPDESRTVTLRWPVQKSSHSLVVTYQLADADDMHSVSVDLPKFAASVGVQHFYWQLAVPADRHLIDAPARITPEFTWQWDQFGWQRRSTMEQNELENWTGVDLGADLPESTNRYLFSMAGSPARIELWTAARGELVLVASIAVLAWGLLLIYFHILRRPVSLLAMGVVIAGLAAWKAELALLFVQASLLGFALVLLATLIEFAQRRQRVSPTIVRSAGSSIIDPRPAATSVRAIETPAPASTESLPVEIELSTESSSR